MGGAQQVIKGRGLIRLLTVRSGGAYLFEEALVNADQANEWADQVWPDED